jgi:hypothetical protein
VGLTGRMNLCCSEHVSPQGGRRAEYEGLRIERLQSRTGRKKGRCWVGEERREGEKQREVGGGPVLIFRESGGGPVHAPCPMRGVAVSRCGLAATSFTL